MEQAKAELSDWQGRGLSVMEMSHRSKEFVEIAARAERDFRELLNIGDDYAVLFLQGSASSQFAAVPLNLLDGNDVAETAQRVIVMYAGRKVEEASVGDLFAKPLHPYTRGLMNSIPRLDLIRGAESANARLQEIPGIVPALTALPKGCVFAPRCPLAEDRCRAEYPDYKQDAPGHWVACWRSDVVAGGAGG